MNPNTVARPESSHGPIAFKRAFSAPFHRHAHGRVTRFRWSAALVLISSLLACEGEAPSTDAGRFDGAAVDGAAVDGDAVDGSVGDSGPLDGASLDGVALGDAAPDGVSADGSVLGPTLRLSGDPGPSGESAVLLGMSIQVPNLADGSGALIDESLLGPRWMALPRSFVRFPAGTDSYSRGEDDPLMRYFLEVFLPKYPDVPNDQTWSPQLPASAFAEWVHPGLQRISLGNEPPNHPDWFPSEGDGPGAAYVSFAREVYESYPELADRFWIQTGKPEVLRYAERSGLNEQGLARHRDLLEAAAAAVAAGDLPPRVITTHKLLDIYSADRLAFYRELLDDYRGYFGGEVQVCFQEYKYKAEEVVTVRSALRVAEFLLIMSRLRYEQGDIVSGGAFQQGFGPGTANLIGLDDPITRAWTATALTDLWEEFGQTLAAGQYLYSSVEGRPDELQVEVFSVDGELRVLFANNGASDVPLELRRRGTLFAVTGPGESDAPRARRHDYEGILPAGTAGSIRLR